MRIIILRMCLFAVVAVFPRASDAETVSRCDEAVVKSDVPQILSELKNQLRGDAFSDAFGIYVRDLEQLERPVQVVVDKEITFLRTKCRPFNAEADQYEAAWRVWESSRCVTAPIDKDEVPACQARKAELDAWRARLLNTYAQLTNEWEQITREVIGVNAQLKNPALNAQNVLNPDYTEQSLRLYTWHILKRVKSGQIKSCQAFALIADKLGARVTRQDLFIDYLSRGFIELSHPVHIIIGDPPFRPMAGDTFDSSGFKAVFYEKSTENQVRHAAGYLAVGFDSNFGVSNAALLSFRYDLARRHPETADFRLAMYAAHLGFRLRHGILKTSNFGEAMRKDFCE